MFEDPLLWDALELLQSDGYFLAASVDPFVFQLTRKGRRMRRRTMRLLRKALSGPSASDHLAECEETLRFYRPMDPDGTIHPV